MTVDLDKLRRVRAKTSASIPACRDALAATGDDVAAAIASLQTAEERIAARWPSFEPAEAPPPPLPPPVADDGDPFDALAALLAERPAEHTMIGPLDPDGLAALAARYRDKFGAEMPGAFVRFMSLYNGMTPDAATGILSAADSLRRGLPARRRGCSRADADVR